MTANNHIVSLDDISQAHERIADYIHKTPVQTSQRLNQRSGSFLFFKCENFQRTGSFKIRGATNALFSYSDDQLRSGVATHSSGNFAAALAQAAAWRGIRAYIVMPENAPEIKKSAVKTYGGEIIFCAPSLKAREKKLKEVVEKTSARFIHPFNQPAVIAGQGTAAIELTDQCHALDYIVVPLGGGGLISGIALAAEAISPHTAVIGVEPALADDALQSLKAGKIIPSAYPDTIADGLRTSLGDLTFPIIKQHVREIITVSESEIVESMRLIWERLKIVVEPSAAVSLAAILKNKEKFRDKKTAVVLSGGNVDLTQLPW